MKSGNGDSRFLQLAAHLPDYVNLVDRDRRFRWTNRLAPGLSWEQVEGTRVDDWVTPESRADAIAAIEQCFETGDHTTYRVTAYGDGVAIGHYENRVVPSPTQDGSSHVLILTRDVTAQVNTINQLNESQHRLARAMSSGRIGLWEYDPDTRIIQRSRELASSLGLPEQEQPFTPYSTQLHPDDRDRVDAWARSIVHGQMQTTEVEYRLHAPDGGYRWIIDHAAQQILDNGRSLITGVMFDVTELRRAEQERLELKRLLERAQRLESIGLLAGGIAHDFNNLLMIIQTSADMAAQQQQAGKSIDEELEHIKSACSRAASLTTQLLAFGRRSELQVQVLDIREVMRAVHRLIRRLLPKNINVELELPELALSVRGDQHQLEQVLLNLCINARDAMPHGGSLRLAAARIDGEIELLVSDTGTGIAELELEHIFEPFYTSKPQGTGLGLAMVHGIVQQHHGTINVTSQLDVGSTFRLRLPSAADVAPQSAVAPPPVLAGHGRLLVAEDEAVILEMLAQILTHAGYEVVTAVDGQDALDKWHEHDGNFDLVLLDAVMPRLDGLATYERLRSLDAHIPVLFSSGYAAVNNNVPNNGWGGERPPMLSKPYEFHTLLRVVARTLAQRVEKKVGSVGE